jgi:hypothetical protein
MPFSAPIGTEEERASGKIWPGRWHDANPYLSHYSLGVTAQAGELNRA